MPAEQPAVAAARNPDRMLERMPWESLRALLVGDDDQRDQTLSRLRAFAAELLRWNRGVSNLISRADEPRLVERHLGESLAGVAVINALDCNRLVDFGSGGGFPALPLAISGVGKSWILVESRRNKTLFLRRVIEALSIPSVIVATGRLEVLIEQEPEALQCDALTSRATMKVGPTLEMAARIVRPGGHAILWKGSGLAQELATTQRTWETEWEPPTTHVLADGRGSIAVFMRK